MSKIGEMVQLELLRKDALIERTLELYMEEVHNKSYSDFKETYSKLHNVEFKGLKRRIYRCNEQEEFFYKGEHLFSVIGSCATGFSIHSYWRG